MSDDRFAELVRHVGAFHITDRTMSAAQASAEEALRAGNIDARGRKNYLQAVRHYFSGFEREARGALRDVDKRLEGLNQVVFNLTAERAVAVKRIEATRSVLGEVTDLENAAR